MNYDYISEARKLISTLQTEEMDTLASNLSTVLDSASNSTELLMGLRFYLLEIPSSCVSAPTLLKMKTLLNEIDNILK
jgi:hypothetical protein